MLHWIPSPTPNPAPKNGEKDPAAEALLRNLGIKTEGKGDGDE